MTANTIRKMKADGIESARWGIERKLAVTLANIKKLERELSDRQAKGYKTEAVEDSIVFDTAKAEALGGGP